METVEIKNVVGIEIKDVVGIEITAVRESVTGDSWREIIIKTARGPVEIVLCAEDIDQLKVAL